MVKWQKSCRPTRACMADNVIAFTDRPIWLLEVTWERSHVHAMPPRRRPREASRLQRSAPREPTIEDGETENLATS